jgi:hypothetical protein
MTLRDRFVPAEFQKGANICASIMRNAELVRRSACYTAESGTWPDLAPLGKIFPVGPVFAFSLARGVRRQAPFHSFIYMGDAASACGPDAKGLGS